MKLLKKRWKLFLLALMASCCFTIFVHAEVAPPEERFEDEFSFMKLLNKNGLHDMEDERWNVYGQGTFIHNFMEAFSAQYTNLNGSTNSLLPNAQQSFTGTASLYLGLKLWETGQVYMSPEMISAKPLSNLKGLGGAIQNFELQKGGSEKPLFYLSRNYIRQIINLGGTPVKIESDPLQLGTTVDSHRLILYGGTLSVMDIFDKNMYSADLRQQFLNMAFLAFAAYDYAADSRGFTTGVAAEYYYDDWAIRFGRFATPKQPNQLELDYNIFNYYGDQLEIEHRHQLFGRKGIVRVLGFRNREWMGKFSDAVSTYRANPAQNAAACAPAGLFNYGSTNDTAPDLCWVRKANYKMGAGLNIEQSITDDIGVFFRGMYSDGHTELVSYLAADRSISMGALTYGGAWGRNKDLLGLGFSQGWISKSHAQYLSMGGVDAFVGDGALNEKPERVVDLFYSYNLFSSLWISGDYQFIENPGFNAARGPVNIFSVRAHVEF